MSDAYAFPLCIQLAAPLDPMGDAEFETTLKLLRDLGFYGVELNILDFDRIDPVAFKGYLESFGLKLSMIATGGFAKKQGLSLSSADPACRQAAVQNLNKIARFAEASGSGVICGFIKGGPGDDPAAAKANMIESLKELKSLNAGCKAPVYLEATNHYEATTVNLVSAGMELADMVGGGFKVLPDSYHMNIDEDDMNAAIVSAMGYFSNFHISDNNRYFPGYGSIDFRGVLGLLESLKYQGTISIEGRLRHGLLDDIRFSATHIRHVSEQLKK